MSHTIVACRIRILMIVISALVVSGCGRGVPTASIASGEPADKEEPEVTHPVRLTADNNAIISPAKSLASNPEVLIRTSLGDLRVRLHANKSPVTVGAFLSNYVGRGFYDDLIFHYVDKSSMVIAGTYSQDLQRQEPDASIRNEAHNGLSNRRGTLAMTHDRDDAQSAGSEFFINVIDNPSFDHQSRDSDATYGYCVFGEIVEGLEVLDRIVNSAVETRGEFENIPVEPIVIHSIQQLQ